MDKTQETYGRMLRILKGLVPGVNPERILVDFEKAMINEVRAQFPASTIGGCYFHLSQSLNRKVTELGKKREYEQDVEFRSQVGYLLYPSSEINM